MSLCWEIMTLFFALAMALSLVMRLAHAVGLILRDLYGSGNCLSNALVRCARESWFSVKRASTSIATMPCIGTEEGPSKDFAASGATLR